MKPTNINYSLPRSFFRRSTRRMRILAASLVVITAVLVFQYYLAVVNPYFANAYTGQGEGTLVNPYRISDCEELQEMKDHLGSTFVLVNDIDCSASSGWDGGQGFAPIHNFNGVFDGRNYTISNLRINRPTLWNVGLFSVIKNGATVRNVWLTSTNTDGPDIYGQGLVGAVVGLVEVGASVTNAHTDMTVRGAPAEDDNGNVGGLVGLNQGAVSNSSSAGKVELGQNGIGGKNIVIGGLVGRDEDTGSGLGIYDSYSTAEVTTGTEADNLFVNAPQCGGLVGSVSGGREYLRNYAAGKVICNQVNSRVGGFVGSIDNDSYSNFSYNFATDEVTATNTTWIGGFHGFMFGAALWMGNNAIDVTATQQSACGPLSNDCALINPNGLDGLYFTNPASDIFATWDTEAVWDIPGVAENGDTYPLHKTYQVQASAPTGLEVYRDGADFHLSWSPVADTGGRALGIVDYIVEYRIHPPNNVGISEWFTVDDQYTTDPQTVISGLDVPGAYDFRVTAFNSRGRGLPSEPLNFLTGMPESAPVISQVTTTAMSASLTWNAIDLASSYNVEYKTGSGAWQSSSAIAYDGTTATIYSLQPQTNYTFRVIATNGVGSGPWSGEVSATTSVQQSYTISSCQQLQNMQDDLEGLYTLTTNLDCAETAGWNSGQGFAPIGQYPATFRGKFDGRNNTISNLVIQRQFAGSDETRMWGAGLFGVTNNADVKNLTISGATFTATFQYEPNVDANGNGIPDADFTDNIPQGTGDLTTANANAAAADAQASLAGVGIVGAGGVVGVVGGSGIYTNLRVVNSVISGLQAGGVLGMIVPSAALSPSGNAPAATADLIIDSLSSSGFVNGLAAGGVVGAAVSDSGILAASPGLGTVVIANATSSAQVSAQVGGGLVGLSFSLSVLLPTYPESKTSPAAFRSSIDTALTAQGILIKNSSATGNVSTCEVGTDLQIGVLGGLIGLGIGTILQNTSATGEVTVCTASNSDFQPTGGLLGGLAGSLLISKVENSTATGNVRTINNIEPDQVAGNFFLGMAGGLAGLVASAGSGDTAVINNSSATGDVSLAGINGLNALNGGLAGALVGSGTIRDSHATGKVTTEASNKSFVSIRSSGGLIGFSAGVDVPYIAGIILQDPHPSTYGMTIDNSYATGTIETKSNNTGLSLDSAGGMAGWLFGKVRVTRSFATGAVTNNFNDDLLVDSRNQDNLAKSFLDQSTGIANSGGLVGTTLGLDVNKALNTAFNIPSTAPVDGVVIESSYASGNVKGNISGGLIGAAEFGLKINKAYATGNVRGTGAVGGLIGETDVVGGVFATISGGLLTQAVQDLPYVSTQNVNQDSLKIGLTAVLSAMGRSEITNTYATGSVTGIPVQFTLKLGDSNTTNLWKPTSLATFAGGLIGLNANIGGTVADSYASGDVQITPPPTLSNERPVYPNAKPPTLPTFAGGLFGASVLLPQPKWAALAELPPNTPFTSEVINGLFDTPATYKNLFSASKLSIPGSTITGGLAGAVLSPVDGIVPNLLPENVIYDISNTYYDNSRITFTDCSGPESVEEVARGVVRSSDFPDSQGQNWAEVAGNEQTVDAVTNTYIKPLVKEVSCNPVNQNNTQPNYFKNNKSNAPLDTWNFNTIWVTQKNDYPKFVAGVDTDIPSDGTPTGGGQPTAVPTLPPDTALTIARLASPTAGLKIDGGQVKYAWIEAVPILLIRSLPYLIILMLLLLALRYSYEALRQYRQLKKYHNNLLRITATKNAVNDFLAITTHHLTTPVAIMSGAVELLQSLKKVSSARVSILQSKIKSLSDAVSKLATANEVSARESVNREKTIHRQIPNPLKNKAVWIPIAVTFGLLVTVNVLCMQLGLLNRSPLRIAIELTIFALAAALVALSFRYRQTLEQNNLLAKEELAIESSLYRQREQFIPQATALVADQYESLQVASAPMKGQAYAKLFFNGLTMLGGINTALANLQKFSHFTADPPLFDVSHYVDKAVADAKGRASEKQLTITTKNTPGLSTRIQPAEITQLIDSLLDNAIKFSNSSGKISVVLQRHFSNLQFTVQDEGIGISEAKLATLLKPFVRGTDSMQFNYEGLGLGLYSDSLIVNKLGGNIKISSRPGHGTTVTVSLPIIHGSANAAPILVAPQQPPSTAQ